MAKTSKMLPTDLLFKYLEILETTNSHLLQFHEASAKMHAENKISKSFLDQNMNVLIKKSDINNKVIDDIEARIFKAMRRDLGMHIVLPDQFASIEEKIKQEMDKHAKLIKKDTSSIGKDELAKGLKSGKFDVVKPDLKTK